MTLLGGSGENPFGDKETFLVGANAGAAVAVYGGAGDDSMTVLSATLDGSLSGISFVGGAGADTLVVDDDQVHTPISSTPTRSMSAVGSFPIPARRPFGSAPATSPIRSR